MKPPDFVKRPAGKVDPERSTGVPCQMCRHYQASGKPPRAFAPDGNCAVCGGKGRVKLKRR